MIYPILEWRMMIDILLVSRTFVFSCLCNAWQSWNTIFVPLPLPIFSGRLVGIPSRCFIIEQNKPSKIGIEKKKIFLVGVEKNLLTHSCVERPIRFF